MHTHVVDGTVFVFLGVILVAFDSVGFATLAGGIGVWLILH